MILYIIESKILFINEEKKTFFLEYFIRIIRWCLWTKSHILTFFFAPGFPFVIDHFKILWDIEISSSKLNKTITSSKVTIQSTEKMKIYVTKTGIFKYHLYLVLKMRNIFLFTGTYILFNLVNDYNYISWIWSYMLFIWNGTCYSYISFIYKY